MTFLRLERLGVVRGIKVTGTGRNPGDLLEDLDFLLGDLDFLLGDLDFLLGDL